MGTSRSSRLHSQLYLCQSSPRHDQWLAGFLFSYDRYAQIIKHHRSLMVIQHFHWRNSRSLSQQKIHKKNFYRVFVDRSHLLHLFIGNASLSSLVLNHYFSFIMRNSIWWTVHSDEHLNSLAFKLKTCHSAISRSKSSHYICHGRIFLIILWSFSPHNSNHWCSRSSLDSFRLLPSCSFDSIEIGVSLVQRKSLKLKIKS